MARFTLCSFREKILNAQNGGAKGVVILNINDPDVKNILYMKCNHKSCNDINIPAVFIEINPIVHIG